MTPRLFAALLLLALGCDAGEKPSSPPAPAPAPVRPADPRLESIRLDLDRLDTEMHQIADAIVHARTATELSAAASRLRDMKMLQADVQRRLAEVRASSDDRKLLHYVASDG